MHYCLGATWEQGRGEIEMRESVQLSVEHLGVVMTGMKIEGRVGGGNVQPSSEKPTEICELSWDVVQ